MCVPAAAAAACDGAVCCVGQVSPSAGDCAGGGADVLVGGLQALVQLSAVVGPALNPHLKLLLAVVCTSPHCRLCCTALQLPGPLTLHVTLTLTRRTYQPTLLTLLYSSTATRSPNPTCNPNPPYVPAHTVDSVVQLYRYWVLLSEILGVFKYPKHLGR